MFVRLIKYYCFLEHHIRIRNIKKEKKPRSSEVYQKNHRTITHHFLPNERVTSPSSDEEDSESTLESDNSSESQKHLISNNNYAYVTKGKRRKKLRPPKLMRKITKHIRLITSDERIKTKQTALKFVVTEVEPSPIGDKNSTPEKRKSPNLSPREKYNRNGLALVTYNPRSRHDENWEDEEWSNLSEEDDFSDYHNEEKRDVENEHRAEHRAQSLDEDFTGRFLIFNFLMKSEV